MVSAFASTLANVSLDQHSKFHMLDETDFALCQQIERYWDETVGGFSSCSAVPWSAVFVSWCVKQAGAKSTEFKFAAAHSVFVNDAINHPRAYEGLRFNAEPPAIGDIIQNNRGGSHHDFDFARTHANYASHSAIVVEIGHDTHGKYALTIGGNEGDSVRSKRVACDAGGLIQQKPSSPFIALLKCRK